VGDSAELAVDEDLNCNILSYMSRDSRLSGVLHILLHLAERQGPVTSEALAKIMQTNPVVIRRTLAGLRERGYVRSEKGHGGGWAIAQNLAAITLRDIYEGIGSPSVFAIGNRSDTPDCAVEQAVNAALDAGLRNAETLLLAAFAEVTLENLSADFHHRLAQRAPGFSQGHRHGD
jgi:DNA-binding IscR family transcriptional regulator